MERITLVEYHDITDLVESQNAGPFLDSIDYLTLKTIIKWKNNSSALGIVAVHEN